MNHHRLAIAVALAALFGGALASPRAGALQNKAAAAEAVKANPDLVGALAKEIEGTPEQAAGAAGALFGVAQQRLKPEEFSQVDKSVPGMASFLKAAPAGGGVTGGAKANNPLAQAAGLASAASAFSKLGLKPSMVAKAIPVLTGFVSKSGGADVGKLLAGALK
jgi:hypothetical protein